VLVTNTADLGRTLATYLKPDVTLHPSTSAIGFIHRKLPNADIYFIANTDNQSHDFEANFRTDKTSAEWWNAFTDTRSPAEKGHALKTRLEPYESRVLVFSNNAANDRDHPQPKAAATQSKTIDLSHDWNISFDKNGASEHMETLHSWTEKAATRYYSGTATYTRTINMPEQLMRAESLFLDFGQGTPVERSPSHLPGMRSWLESLVREAALVYVNGKLAGSIWHPPYRLELKSLLHAGNNDLKIVVANLAINALAGQAAPDYRLLNSRYGERFVPQDMNNLEPLPAGILGPIRLVPANENSAIQ